jgi:hypothetical protein
MIYFNLDKLLRQRTVSVISAKSGTSDVPDMLDADPTSIEIKSKRFFRKPFIFKILKLNLPELNWIILGCITSVTFGAITPVSI